MSDNAKHLAESRAYAQEQGAMMGDTRECRSQMCDVTGRHRISAHVSWEAEQIVRLVALVDRMRADLVSGVAMITHHIQRCAKNAGTGNDNCPPCEHLAGLRARLEARLRELDSGGAL